MNIKLVTAFLVGLTVTMPLAVSALPATLAETSLYLVFDDAFAIRVPEPGMTWSLVPAGERTEVRIFRAAGDVFAALRLEAAVGAAGRVLELPSDFFSRDTAVSTASTDSGSCLTGNLGMVVCADVTYAGGSGPIWHHGRVENVPSGHECVSGTGCLLIQGCTHVSCPNEAWFWVEPTATYASVCGTWRAWTYVNARATYPGVSPATPDVFPTWWTTS